MIVKLFYSYAHEDEEWRRALEKHLSLMKNQSLIEGWSDRDIQAGGEWEEKISNQLHEATIILLLISPDFMASAYCYSIEMKEAMKRQTTGEAVVIPIIIRPVDWQQAPFGKLQALPTNGKPVTSWSNKDEAFYDVARGIRRVVEALRKSP